MKKRLTWFDRINFYLFLVIFPGYVLVQAMVALGYSEPILGGYMVPMFTIFIPLLLWKYVKLLRKAEISKIEALFFVIVIYRLGLALGHFGFETLGSYRTEYLTFQFAGIILDVGAFLLFRTLSVKPTDKNVLLIISIIIVLVVFLNSDGLKFKLLSSDFRDDSLAGYQQYARNIVVLGFLALAVARAAYLRYLILISFSFILFLVSARTELILFFCSSIVFLQFTSVHRGPNSTIIGIVLFFVFAVAAEQILYMFPESRLFDLTDLDNSTSYLARRLTTNLAWEMIMNNPIIGDYGGYVHAIGMGYFSHNILSAWVDLGLLGMFFYLLLIFLVLLQVLELVKKNVISYWAGSLSLLCSMFWIVALFTAKDYTYMFCGITVGIISNTMVIMLQARRRQVGILKN